MQQAGRDPYLTTHRRVSLGLQQRLHGSQPLLLDLALQRSIEYALAFAAGLVWGFAIGQELHDLLSVAMAARKKERGLSVGVDGCEATVGTLLWPAQ